MGIAQNLGKWQNYVHYLMLTGFLFFIHHLTDIWGVEAYAINNGTIGWITLFMFYAVGFFIADTLIHTFFSILPQPYKWDD